jgi:NADP-dependent 3-hydroxy acid dehydrogenase YdfG
VWGQVEGLSAIVTGGTAGIGEAIVRLFRQRGARGGYTAQ